MPACTGLSSLSESANNSFLAVRKLPEKWIQVELSETQNDVVVRITDSGNGIPKEHHEKIMQPFFFNQASG